MKSYLLIIGICTCLVQISCESHEKHHENAGVFLVTSPLKKDTALIKEYVAQVKSAQHIELRALERGYLRNIYVDEGEHIKKGQLMFKVMPNIYEAELATAAAEARVAEIEYLNTKALADSNIVSPNELAMAKAKYEKALAEQKLAETHLGFTEIRAPFDGIMDRFYVRVGSLLDEGELLSSLSDNSTMWIYFNVPEAEYLDYKTEVKKGEEPELEFLMANNKKFPLKGKLTTIEADFNNETGNIAFRATFPNPTGLLRHGETGNILMEVPFKDALIIPQKATFEVLDKKYVFVIDEYNKLQTRHITIAAELPHLYLIDSGLTESDKILLEGLRKVKNQQEIAIDFVEPQLAIQQLSLYAE